MLKPHSRQHTTAAPIVYTAPRFLLLLGSNCRRFPLHHCRLVVFSVAVRSHTEVGLIVFYANIAFYVCVLLFTVILYTATAAFERNKYCIGP